ncbi:AfsR/SARP family transcriptional regulator [Solwaraspora sp. WMMA2056]|uniref:AfsR/SARP family transcriptional regulator n=1 Tax=Solwaraspora sp. WMMA2056 TaxID=3015161 RepID=UPI00259B8503|nr:AfsR/SARP family transcriptional regulator [Solwaraspora sp. WMMA2056]WJK38252.1 AfsR/SARP family transcriptional regulator [Solwaraspora sp. WMMA2056]
MLHFQVLGPLEVFDDDGTVVTPTPPKVGRVLALLLLRANQVVSTDAIIDELWGEDPPPSAVGTAQTYIYQLRKCLDPRIRTGGEWLLTKPPGYLMRIAPSQLDATTFEALSRQGRQMLERGQPEQAAPLLRRALELWQGQSLANLRRGGLLQAHAIRLEEDRMRTLELRIQADAELGLHRQLIGEIRSLVATNPLNEWLYGQLMVALARTGRRGEALQTYQDLRRVLDHQLGLTPQPELQRLHRELLSHGEPAMSSTWLYRSVLSAA